MLVGQTDFLPDPIDMTFLILDVRKGTQVYAMIDNDDQNPVNNCIPSSENASTNARVMANHIEDND